MLYARFVQVRRGYSNLSTAWVLANRLCEYGVGTLGPPSREYGAGTHLIDINLNRGRFGEAGLGGGDHGDHWPDVNSTAGGRNVCGDQRPRLGRPDRHVNDPSCGRYSPAGIHLTGRDHEITLKIRDRSRELAASVQFLTARLSRDYQFLPLSAVGSISIAFNSTIADKAASKSRLGSAWEDDMPDWTRLGCARV